MAWRETQALEEAGVDPEGNEYNEARAKAADWHYRAIRRQADARKQLGSLVPVDLIADAVEEDYERVRSRLNSVPGRVSVQAAAETDASIVRTMIEKAIRDALSNLSEPADVVTRAGGNPASSAFDHLDLDMTAADDAEDFDDMEGADVDDA